MADDLIKKTDAVTGVMVVIAIGFAKHVEHTVTDILALFIDFQIAGVDLSVWLLYGLLWMGTLSLVILIRTLGTDNE